MKHRHKLNTIIAIVVLVATFIVSCKENMGTPDIRLVSVKNLIEPINAREVALQSGLSDVIYFEWDLVDAKEAGILTYQVAFDTQDGDFSDPIYVVKADNNGFANSVSIPHKDINKIAGKAGIDPSATGTLKWTVFSAKGTKKMKASIENMLTITRLGGFEEIPSEIFITGPATEGGSNISAATETKKIAEGVFEIYTKLMKGESFQFINSKLENSITYSLKDENIIIDGATEVEETGVYKLYLDFEIGSFEMTPINKVSLFLNWSQQLIDLPYIGNGVWGVKDYSISGLSGNDNSDDRYKFRMVSGTGETEWRAPNNDSKPTGDPEYYYMVEKTNVQQWTNGEIWKSPATDGWSGKKYDIFFILSPSETYTHNLVIK